MTPSKLFRTACLLFGLLALTTTPALAQVSGGADFVSRYVFRGIDFGESFSVQPTLQYSSDGFTVGSWASYAITAGGANEHDLYVSYANGPIEVGLTDYFFPVPGGGESAEFFNFDSETTGHILEPYLAFSGTQSFPISLYAAINAFASDASDPDNSIYLEAGYGFMVEDVSLGLTVGFVPQESAFYGTTAPSFINLGLSASKAVEITDSFSLPLLVQYIINPESERTFFVFGFSLSM